MRLTRRQLISRGVPAIGLAGVVTANCPRAALARLQTVHRGGVPRVALPRYPHTFDAGESDGWEVGWVSSLIYDFPLRATAEGDIVAGLAVSVLGNEDGSRIELTVRNGVTFSDGEVLTADDIAWSIAQASSNASSPEAWRWTMLQAIDVTDDNRVALTLLERDATLRASLASPLVPVIPDGSTIGESEFSALPTGTGPFLPSSDDGETLRFRRNSRHWVIGQPRFDGVNVIAIEQEIERTTSLVTGLVDMVPDVPSLDIPLLDEDSRISLYGDISRRSCAVVLRMDHSPLDDVRVRLLVASSIDREALVEGATAGTGRAADWLFAPEHWAGPLNDDLAEPPPPADIRDQFAALGLLPGWSLRMVCPEQEPALANTAILLQEQLAQVGIAIVMDLLDPEAMKAATDAGDFDLAMVHLPPWIDPHEVAYPWLHSSGPRNLSAYASDRMDRTLALARGVEHRDQRGALYRDVQRLVQTDVPLVPLFATPWIDGVKARIEGFETGLPTTAQGLATAWFGDP